MLTQNLAQSERNQVQTHSIPTLGAIMLSNFQINFTCIDYLAHLLFRLGFLVITSGWTVQKKEASISLKILTKHRRVVSSKFPKSFRGVRDVVELCEFLKV